MDQAALYEEDIYAWSQHQAAVLRRMAANPAALPNDLDLEHVAEEIEEVGNEQRFGVESNLIQAFMHLIKTVALPEDPAVRHWTKEIRAFLYNAAAGTAPRCGACLTTGSSGRTPAGWRRRISRTTGASPRSCRESAPSAWRNSWAARRIRGDWRRASPRPLRR